MLPRLQPPKIQKNAEVDKGNTELKQFEPNVKGYENDRELHQSEQRGAGKAGAPVQGRGKTVYPALTYRRDSEKARKIRYAAVRNYGGCGHVPLPGV